MKRARILVVEDNVPSRILVCEILAHRGHEVLEAGSVEEARALLFPATTRRRPDLVLMDLQIPGGGGQDVLRAIREDQDLASLPVVVVTACAMAGDRERLLRSGFDAYLSKPIDTRNIGPHLEALVERAGEAR